MGRWGGRNSPYTGARDDWSPEAREAAAKARQAQAHHTERSKHHEGEAKSRGESLASPAHGSHAEASSHHGSAAFLHGRTAEEHEKGGHEAAEYEKKAKRQSGIANAASKRAESAANYPTEKQNAYQTSTTTEGQRREAALRRLNQNRRTISSGR